VDYRIEARAFLTSRRARITPEQAGLPVHGGSNRGVVGLRREELAMLAGVSVDYYTRLERGNLSRASASVLEAIARALQLDDAERSHLFDLARATNTGTAASARHRSPTQQRVRPGVMRVLEAITDAPADVRNGRRDILAANRLGRALYSEMYVDPVRPVNVARFTFLSSRARDFFRDWEQAASDIVANMRTEAGRKPYDKELSDLVGELSTRSDEFRVRWAAHHVRHHNTGVKRIHHPLVGDLELSYEAMQLPADPGLSLIVYTAQPDSPTQEALRFLASWADGHDEQQQLGRPADQLGAGGQSSGRSTRRRRPGEQGAHADGLGTQSPREFSPLDHPRGRGFATAPRHRLDRPIPDPPLRPGDRSRRDPRCPH
jgi:transcriptional regulator with XRE-family HTH domain